MSKDDAGKGAPDNPFTILFLCTGNSARSIIAEAVLNRMGGGKFKAFSAGSTPKGDVHPHTVRLLNSLGYDTGDLRSKSWDEFAGPDAVEFDCIITVCDNAANEVCPVWPGAPISSHWGLPDPAAATGTDAQIAQAFADAHRLIARRIEALVNLPIAALDRMAMKQAIDKIGREADAPQKV